MSITKRLDFLQCSRHDVSMNLKDKTLYPFWIKEHIRYGDLDPVGHANNASYATYFESARVKLLSRLKGAINEEKSSHDTAIVQLNISFMKELNLHDEIEVGVKIGKISSRSFHIHSAIFKENICHATADAVAVLIDKEKRCAVSLPQETRDFLEKC